MRYLRLALAIALAPAFVPAFAGDAVILMVDDYAPPGGDGTARFPFHDLRDAVEAAATTSERVIIKVRPGEYVLTEPLVIERSFIELSGSTELVEGADGWPTGEAVPDTETRINAANPATSQSVFVVGQPNLGPLLSDVTIHGFAQIAEAEQAMAFLTEQSPGSAFVNAERFWIELASHRPRGALAALEKDRSDLVGSWRAMALAQVGDLDGALAELEQALVKGWRDVDQMYGGPYFVPLRRDPRFLPLLAKYGIALKPAGRAPAAASQPVPDALPAAPAR